MSVQLILYPQSFDGVPNAFSAANSEMIVNGTDFTSFLANETNYSATTTLAQTAVNALVSTAASNTWYAYHAYPGGGVVGAANNAAFSGYAGCMQRINGLIAGAVYDVTLVVGSFPMTAGFTLRIYNGVTLVSSTAIPATTTLSTVQFTAPSANNTTFVIDFYDPTTPTGFGSVSVKMASTQPSGAIQLLENGQVICDLYEDEDIPLSLSVDNFKNVAEKIQSYSKAFNLPATKRNNQIFNQMYEVTRSDDGIIFNPYVRTQCVLKQDGFLLFEGYMRMLDISDKEGEISYNVNLYSEVIALADILKDRTFSDLDFTELEHAYNITQIKYSWNSAGTGITYTNPSTSGFRHANSTLKYPFCDWNHQYTVNSIGNPDLPNLESAFRPFIRLKYLVDRIFNAPNTPFSYTSAFFNGTDFEALYMDFNWGNAGTGVTDGFIYASNADETVSYGSTATTIDNDSTIDGVNPDGTTITASDFYSVSTNTFTSTTDNTWVQATSILKILSMSSDFQSVTVSVWKNGSLMMSSSQTFSVGNTFTNSFFGYFLDTGDTLEVKITTGAGITLTLDSESSIKFYVKSYNINTNSSLLSLRGDLGQWEFLQGIMTMFNLVTLVDPDNPNNLLIEPYADVFIRNSVSGNISDMTLASRGITHDWTDKIDVSQMKLEPLTDLNKKTIFKFVEDDDDFCFMEYKRQTQPPIVGVDTGHLYGSKVWDATAFTVLDGEDEVVAEPFAATIPAPLMSQYTDFIVPKLYASSDGEDEDFDNSPRIMYNNGIHDLSSCTYHIPSQNGVGYISAEDQYLRFSHLTNVPTVAGSTSDFHFGECQLLPGLGNATPDNLFNGYWLPYYAELYNANTRTMTIKVNLNAGDISTFKFNDTVMLKNRQYRVNNISYKPNDLATVEFILIQ